MHGQAHWIRELTGDFTYCFSIFHVRVSPGVTGNKSALQRTEVGTTHIILDCLVIICTSKYISKYLIYKIE